ncbi:MAG: Y-family DNA polymerase [Methyloligellaceae bacterium]
MTQRVVSVWLPHWQTDRLERQKQSGAPREPLVLYLPEKGGDRVVALNREAEKQGLKKGKLLTDSKAVLPSLQALPADPLNAALDLEKLARWCVRFAPWISVDEPDGLWMDVTGVPHLFGGELKFLQHLKQHFNRLKLNARIAIADTPGAAWPFARFSRDVLSCIPSGQQKQLGYHLPVQALRITGQQAGQLYRLGLRKLGQLYDISAHNFRPRFGKLLIQRLEQFLYPSRETLSPLIPEPDYCSSFGLPEPVSRIEDIRASADLLIKRVCKQLMKDGKGASIFTLILHGVDGSCDTVIIRTSEATKSDDHVRHLFKERLNSLENSFSKTPEIDAFSLYADEVSALKTKQSDLAGKNTDNSGLPHLIDRLSARLGSKAVRKYSIEERHIPEKTVQTVSPNEAIKPASLPDGKRPILLFSRPEMIRAISEVPDYPPRRFEWRYRTYHVTKAEGPERISPEWWQSSSKFLTRDYYTVEDETGARFWLFREGLFLRETQSPQWFIHGVFS